MKNHRTLPQKIVFNHLAFSTLVQADLSDWLSLEPPERVESSWLFVQRQMEGLKKKNLSIGSSTPSSRKDAALSTFFEMEAYCAQTNLFLPHRLAEARLDVRGIISSARLVIDQILSDLSVDALGRCLEDVAFGPGMTYGCESRADASFIMKLAKTQTITPKALPYVRPLLKKNPAFASWFQEVKVVKGNRVTTVPKTALIDRTIAIEPSVNVLLQKGVDRYMRSRLNRWGVDLTDQTTGWPLAERGSLDGSYSTIDLSSASDCVSIAAVEALLPQEWVGLLDDLRSHQYYVDGEWRTYHKFSSMGNANTFPLETIIFYGLMRSVVDFCGGGEVVVYGDDIIVPRNSFLMAIEVLELFGFIPNVAKSFGTGKFRETCGHDYHNGMNVRPIYMSKDPSTEIEVYNLYNRLLLNRQEVPYVRTLAYLFSLVKDPCIVPLYYGAGDEGWRDWQPWVSIEYDAGFMVNQEVADVLLKRSYNPRSQALVYKTYKWTSKPVYIRYEGPLNLQVALYTGDHRPVDISKRRIRRTRKVIPFFPAEKRWLGGAILPSSAYT